jgi:hypothetical protein
MCKDSYIACTLPISDDRAVSVYLRHNFESVTIVNRCILFGKYSISIKDSYFEIIKLTESNPHFLFSCLHHASIVQKTLFIIPTDAHYCKIAGMLK